MDEQLNSQLATMRLLVWAIFILVAVFGVAGINELHHINVNTRGPQACHSPNLPSGDQWLTPHYR